MAAVANIVLADALATPVNHTFIPIGPDLRGAWWFEDQSGASTLGYNRLSVQLTRAGNPAPGENAGNRVNRVKIGIHCPTLETLGTNDAGLTPPSTVAYINRVNIEVISPERCTTQNRKDVRKYAQFLLADPQVIAAIELVQGMF